MAEAAEQPPPIPSDSTVPTLEEVNPEEEDQTQKNNRNVIEDPLASLEKAKIESAKTRVKEVKVTDFNERWPELYNEFLQFPPGTWRPNNFYGYIRENGTVVGGADLGESFFQPQRSECRFEYIPLKMAKKIMYKEQEEKTIEMLKKNKENLQRVVKDLQTKEKDWRFYDDIGRLIIMPTPRLVEYLEKEDKKGIEEEMKQIFEAKKRAERKKKEAELTELKKGKVAITELLPAKGHKPKQSKRKRRECKPKSSKLQETESKGNTEAEGLAPGAPAESKSQVKIVDEEKVEHEVTKKETKTKMKPSKDKLKKEKEPMDASQQKKLAHKKANKAHISGRVPADPCYIAPDGVYRKKKIPLHIGLFKQINFCKKTLPRRNVDWVHSTLTTFYGQHKYRKHPPPVTHLLTEKEKCRRFTELRTRPLDLVYNYSDSRKQTRGFLKIKPSPHPCRVDEEAKYGGHSMRAFTPWNCCKPIPTPKLRGYCRREPWIGWNFPGCCQNWPTTPFGKRKPKVQKKIDKGKWGWWLEKEGAPPIPEEETVYIIVRRKATHISLIVTENNMINDLKRMIEGVLYVAPRDQRLYSGTTRMHGGLSISQFGFNHSNHGRANPAVIFLRIRKKGKWERIAIANLSTACPIPEGMDNMKAEITNRIKSIFSQFVEWEKCMPRHIRRLLTNPIHENDFKKGGKPKATTKVVQPEESSAELDVSAPIEQPADSPDVHPHETIDQDHKEEMKQEDGEAEEEHLEVEESQSTMKRNSSNFLDFLD